jgi:LacI family transcriptional regulator
MPVTLKDIAEACGVSKRTVSEILNRKDKPYSPVTIERVFATAESLGYRPNAQARAVASGKVGTIALVLGEEHYSHLPQRLLHGIHNALAAHDYRLMVTVLSNAQVEDEDFMPEILKSLLVDGILINYHYHFPPRLLEAIERYRVPAIWINVRLDHDAVCFDEAAACTTATERLLALGHRRIAWADRALDSGEDLHYSNTERRDAYVARMQAAGLEPMVLGNPDLKGPMLDRLFSQPDRPTAVIACAHHTAQDLATTAIARGWEIPRDLSLITFARTYSGIPNIPGYEQPWTNLGEAAVDMLMRRLASEDPLPAQSLSSTWLDGTSLAPPRPG